MQRCERITSELAFEVVTILLDALQMVFDVFHILVEGEQLVCKYMGKVAG